MKQTHLKIAKRRELIGEINEKLRYSIHGDAQLVSGKMGDVVLVESDKKITTSLKIKMLAFSKGMNATILKKTRDINTWVISSRRR